MPGTAVAQTWIAVIALLIWPAISLWLYATRPVAQATLWTVLGGFLLLPVGASIKIAEGIPQLDKVSIPALASLVGCVFVAHRPLRIWYKFGLTEVLVSVLLVAPFVTSELNNDPVMSGSVLLPGVGAYDGLSAIFSEFVFVIPFFLGRQLLRSSTHTEETLRTLATAGLIYSLPMLFEIRMSPQLHYWFYGYYQSGFSTEMRFGGFRPSVFVDNSLVAAFFVTTSLVAAAAFWRARTNFVKLSPVTATAYLAVLLILCKSVGSLVYGAVLVPLVYLTKPRFQVRIAAILALLALSYPLLRTADLVPTNSLVHIAEIVNDERAGSLNFRFEHEQALLQRASERIWFGWGRFGRNRIYNEWGQDISVSDGHWVLALGQFGIFGFVAEFGLLAFSVLQAAFSLKFVEVAA